MYIWELASKRNTRRKELSTQKKEEIIRLALQMGEGVIELTIQNGGGVIELAIQNWGVIELAHNLTAIHTHIYIQTSLLTDINLKITTKN